MRAKLRVFSRNGTSVRLNFFKLYLCYWQFTKIKYNVQLILKPQDVALKLESGCPRFR